MVLLKFKDAYPNYKDTFGKDSEMVHLDDYSVYSQSEDKVGSVKDALFEDNTGNIRYLIVDTGIWIFGKQILLPIGLAHFDRNRQRIYVDGLTREQVKNLPEYNDDMTIDRDYENRVRTQYRSLGDSRKRKFMGKEYNADKCRAYPGIAALYCASLDNHDDGDAGLYAMDQNSHEPIRLYQERLVADKNRFKTGEVRVGKQVETKTQKVSVPVENERVVIERSTPSGTTPAAGRHDFKEDEAVRMETYGETYIPQVRIFLKQLPGRIFRDFGGIAG